MPSSYFTCTQEGTRAQALQNLAEELRSQLDTLQTAVQQFKATSAVYQDDHNTPLTKALDDLIAASPTGLSTGSDLLTSGQYNTTTPSENLLAGIGLPTSTTPEQVEELLSSRHGLHVVAGKLLAPGDTSLVGAKKLYERLDGDLIQWRSLLSGDHGLPFVLVALLITQSDGDIGTDCEPGKAPIDETRVLGINTRLRTLALDNGIAITDITPEIYWLAEINTSPATVQLLRSFDLTAEQLGFALTGFTDSGFGTYTVEEPETVSDLVGLDDAGMDRLLSRDGLLTINPFPETSDLVSAAREVLTGRAFQDRDRNGIGTLQPPGLLLLEVLDLETFEDYNTLNSPDIVDRDLYSGAMEESLEMASAAVQVAFDALRSAFATFQDFVNEGLGRILAPLTLVENLFNNYGSGGTQLLQCLFGSGSVNLSLNQEEIDAVIEQINLAVDPLNEITAQLNVTLGALGAPTCLVQSLLAALTENSSGNDQLECANLSDQYNFDIPMDLNELDPDTWSDHELPEPSRTFENLTSITELLNSIVRDAQSMVRDMITWVRNVTLNLDLDFENRSETCSPSSVQGILDQLNVEIGAEARSGG
jgi:hypothetical protein